MADQSSNLELARERRDLIKAEKDIVEGSQRVDLQESLIDRMTYQGHDTAQARRLLLNLQQMLDAWSDHRVLIMRRIAALERAN